MMLSFSFFILTYYTLQTFSAHASFHSFILCMPLIVGYFSPSLSLFLSVFVSCCYILCREQRTHKYVPARAMIDSKNIDYSGFQHRVAHSITIFWISRNCLGKKMASIKHRTVKNAENIFFSENQTFSFHDQTRSNTKQWFLWMNRSDDDGRTQY